MGQVEGKVAIVTGGASGIGKACAQALAEEGARVVVADIDERGGATVVAGIAMAGHTAIFLALDVTQEQHWVDLITRTIDAYGRVDVLVNNAGIGIMCPVTEMSLEDWRRQTAINLDGVFLGTKYAILAMRASGKGSIIIISSLAGLQGSAGLSGYCATKGGVRLFAKAAALECAANGDDIRINSVHPGIIDTPIWTKMDPADTPFAGRAAVPGSNAIDPNALAELRVPLGRAGRPEDVAQGVLFLASDASSYMTGTELVIDGGIFAGNVGARRPAAAPASPQSPQSPQPPVPPAAAGE